MPLLDVDKTLAHVALPFYFGTIISTCKLKCYRIRVLSSIFRLRAVLKQIIGCV